MWLRVILPSVYRYIYCKLTTFMLETFSYRVSSQINNSKVLKQIKVWWVTETRVIKVTISLLYLNILIKYTHHLSTPTYVSLSQTDFFFGLPRILWCVNVNDTSDVSTSSLCLSVKTTACRPPTFSLFLHHSPSSSSIPRGCPESLHYCRHGNAQPFDSGP